MAERKNMCAKDRFRDKNFIMLPTVDVCFKGLMNNPKVRKGFIAALLKEEPKEIRETFLLPTVLRQDYPDDKLGVLDVRVLMEDGRQLDMEMQVAYFEYWDARILFYLSKILFILKMTGSVTDRSLSVTERPEKSTRILWKFRSWNCKSFPKIKKMEMVLSTGCVFLEERTEGSLKRWQRQMNISEKHTENSRNSALTRKRNWNMKPVRKQSGITIPR